MKTAVFLSNCSQVVRLPEAVTLPENVKKIEIATIGRIRIITPADEPWDSWFDGENTSADSTDTRG